MKQDLQKTDYKDVSKKNAEHEEINKELTSFTYVSSHDMQEPLRKIQTFSSRILEQEEKNLSKSGKDYFSRVQQAAKRMQMIIEDLVVYSNINTAEKVFVKTDLNLVFSEVKKDLKELIDRKNALIESGPLSELQVIPSQARLLISNLLNNALKFSHTQKQATVSVTCRILKGIELDDTVLEPLKEYCHINVSDNGIGFESKFSERIFEIFQRLHGKDEYEGTGIGLAICKKIVENHNGLIKASGKLNKGASFDIYIPTVQ